MGDTYFGWVKALKDALMNNVWKSWATVMLKTRLV